MAVVESPDKDGHVAIVRNYTGFDIGARYAELQQVLTVLVQLTFGFSDEIEKLRLAAVAHGTAAVAKIKETIDGKATAQDSDTAGHSAG